MGPVINWISRHAFFGPASVLSTPSQWRRALRSSGSACLAAPANEVPLLNVDSTTIPNILSGLECGVVVNLSRLYSGYVKAMSICLVVLILSDASCRFAASSSAACLSSSICSRPSLHAVTCGIVMEWQPLQKDTKRIKTMLNSGQSCFLCILLQNSVSSIQVLWKIAYFTRPSGWRVSFSLRTSFTKLWRSTYGPSKQRTWYKHEGSRLSLLFRLACDHLGKCWE